jgi:hypothetical protein
MSASHLLSIRHPSAFHTERSSGNLARNASCCSGVGAGGGGGQVVAGGILSTGNGLSYSSLQLTSAGSASRAPHLFCVAVLRIAGIQSCVISMHSVNRN